MSKQICRSSQADSANEQKFTKQGLQQNRVPLIVRANSLTRKNPKSLLSFFRHPKFNTYQSLYQVNSKNRNGHLNHQIKLVPQFSNIDVFVDFLKANLSNNLGKMIPPKDLNRSCVFLGARIVENKFGRRFGFRHIFINIFENPVNYAMIESLPLYSSIGWVSGARVRENQWETRGLTWEIVPEDYQRFIAFLKDATHAYHKAQLPYNYKKGPNSNSFIWWLLNHWGVDIAYLMSGLTYWGTDYWRYHLIPRHLDL